MNVQIKKLEKHLNERGWLVEVLRDDEIKEEMKQVYFSTSKPGAVRGNHYHKRKVEWFCVVKGEAKLVLQDNESGHRQELTLFGDEPSTARIPPNIAHAIQNIGNEDMHLIAIVNEVLNPDDADTYYRKII